jgi:hypothetical protein
MLALLPLVSELLGAIKRHGTTEALLGRMTTVVDLFETMGLSEMLALDARLAVGVPVPSVTDAQP